jgi:UDP-galactopyranose mutase
MGWHVLVVERRNHIAGNAYDCTDEHGVLVHRYGPHVFHTNSERVWAYLSGFTRWRRYEHRVCASVEKKLLPLPINLDAIRHLLPERRRRAVTRLLLTEYGFGATVPILKLRDSSNPIIRRLGERIFEDIYLGYTQKQWGMHPEELDPSVTARVPVRLNRDDRYFVDRFQGVPRGGYTALVARMLGHPSIEVLVNSDFHDLPRRLQRACTVYTGPLDRFFEYDCGRLPYRTLRFEFRHSAATHLQGSGAITYPNQHEFTRTTEFKLITGQKVRGTTVGYEYPLIHEPGETEPYYPVPNSDSRARYARYAALARRRRKVVFCGRLGRYQYLNMDQAVGQALKCFEALRARWS